MQAPVVGEFAQVALIFCTVVPGGHSRGCAGLLKEVDMKIWIPGGIVGLIIIIAIIAMLT